MKKQPGLLNIGLYSACRTKRSIEHTGAFRMEIQQVLSNIRFWSAWQKQSCLLTVSLQPPFTNNLFFTIGFNPHDRHSFLFEIRARSAWTQTFVFTEHRLILRVRNETFCWQHTRPPHENNQFTWTHGYIPHEKATSFIERRGGIHMKTKRRIEIGL